MPRKMSQKQQEKKIAQIYNAHCHGMRISVLRIGALFEMAKKMMAKAASEAEIGAAMIAFVQKEPL